MGKATSTEPPSGWPHGRQAYEGASSSRGSNATQIADSEQPSLVRRLRSVEAAAIAGLVFGASFIAVTGLVRRTPQADAPTAEIGAWLVNDINHDTMLLAQELAVLGLIAFLWFIGVFRRRIGDRVDEFTASVFLGSGLVLAALIAVGISLLTAPTIVFETESEQSVTAYAGVHAAGVAGMSVFGSGLAGVFTLSSTTMIRRSEAFPRWLAIVGYVAATALIVSPFSLLEETLVFPGWVMLISLVLLIRRGELTGRPTS